MSALIQTTISPLKAYKPPYMRTIMGREIAIHHPDPDQLCIFDVAHGLAMQCRYAGHVKQFYSIAEHCHWASFLVPPELALEALMHDAAETNLNDLIQPVKHEISGYKPIEDKYERAYAKRFGLQFPFPIIIKEADLTMYRIESDQLRHSLSREDNEDGPTPLIHLRCWSPHQARKRFLRRYFFLTDKSDTAPIFKRVKAWWKERKLTLQFLFGQDFAPMK